MPISEDFRLALATDSTVTTFASVIPRATEPSGTGIFDLMSGDYGGIGRNVPSHIQLMPFGTDADNETFDVRLYGFNKIAAQSIWVPQLLTDLSVVLSGTQVALIAATTYFADTLTANDGAADSSQWRSIIDCQEDLPASIMVHLRGCRYIQFTFDTDAGALAAAGSNCLWRTMS